MKHLLIFATSFVAFFSCYLHAEVEKIDVIGSHIKRTNVEGTSPVLTIDREQIEQSGYDGLADVLNDLAVASVGGGSENSISDNSSLTTTSLRGIGSSNILVLMDGNRLSPQGGSSVVNLNIFPLSIIERVEILKAGASAIYGSDAVGGVINVVTKKNYTGGQVNIQGSLVQRVERNSLDGLASFADFWNWSDTGPSLTDNTWAGKGDKLTIDASYGGSKNDMNYLVGGQLRFQSPLYLRDRAAGDITPKHYSTYGSPGTWFGDDGVLVPDKNCPAERVDDKGAAGKKCGFNYSTYMQFRPQILQASVFGQAQKEMSGTNWKATALYTYTRPAALIAPAPDEFSNPGGGRPDTRLSAATANRLGGINASTPVTMYYRLVEEEGAGPRIFVSNQQAYQATLSMDRPIGNTLDFDADFTVSGNHNKNTGVSGFAVKSKLLERANKQPAEFNPFLPSGQKNALSDAAYQPVTEVHSNIISLDSALSGELAEGENFALSFATGNLLGWQRYLEENDSITDAGDQWGGGTANSGEGMRAFDGIYGELSLISFNMLEVQVAARTDFYYYLEGTDSRFEITKQKLPFTEIQMPFSPQVAISFQPVEEVKFRASLGTAFKAPNLSSLYHGQTITHPNAIDYFRCPEKTYEQNKEKPECINEQRKMFISGNDQLKAEISTNLNLGVVVEPVKGISASLDYFQISQENLIGSPQSLLEDIFKYELKNGAEALKENFNINVKRTATGLIESISGGPANLSKSHIKGLDLELDMTTPVLVGWDAGLKIEHSHLLYAESEPFVGQGLNVPVPYYEWMQTVFGVENEDRTNTATWPRVPRWRNVATFSLMNKDVGHSFKAVIHNIPGQLKARGDEKEETDYYWRLDLVGTFTLSKQTSLIVGIQDVLAAELPLNDIAGFDTDGGYSNSYLYDLRGRMLNARLTHNF